MVNFRALLEQKKGQRIQVEHSLLTAQKQLSALKIHQDRLEQAQIIIQEVAILTQKQLSYHISELVTLAMQAIFENPYTMEVEFEQKNNSTVASLWFVRNGERVKPIDSSGGGVVDVAAFALKVSIWSLHSPKTRPIMILDEPFRFVSANYRAQTSEMLKMVSQKLGIQIIMVTHSEELIDCADKVIQITQKRGISKVVN